MGERERLERERFGQSAGKDRAASEIAVAGVGMGRACAVTIELLAHQLSTYLFALV